MIQTVRLDEVVRGSWVKTPQGWAYARKVHHNPDTVSIQYDSFNGYDFDGTLFYLLLSRETLIETSSTRP